MKEFITVCPRNCYSTCSFRVFTEGGKVKLATLKPTALISQFHIPELEPVAKEVEGTLIQIMKKAST